MQRKLNKSTPLLLTHTHTTLPTVSVIIYFERLLQLAIADEVIGNHRTPRVPL